MTRSIPFNRPFISGKEWEYLSQAVNGGQASGDGPFGRRCQQLLQERLGVPRVLLTPSCTDALEMAALLLEVGPGDEVVMPSFTFVSTANAFALRGARPVFVDIRPDTLNLDESKLEGVITARTKAIIPVHYAGVGCEMGPIQELAEARRIAIVEDNAHGLSGRYQGKALGTFGGLATVSFHETKNISCGEGGALLINDPGRIARAEVIWHKGTNRGRFLRGEVDKYTWCDVGSSWVLSDLLAAYLLAQLECWDEIASRRRAIWERYQQGLSSWAKSSGVQQPRVPPDCSSSHHLYHLLFPTAGARDRMLQTLKTRGILATFHYVPLHLSEMGARYGGKPGDCPVTEDVSARLLRLPMFNGLSPDDQDYVIEQVMAAGLS